MTTTTELPSPPPSRRVPRPRPDPVDRLDAPVVVAPRSEPAPRAAPAEVDGSTRPCPGCGEAVLSAANKCTACGAWLAVAPAPPAQPAPAAAPVEAGPARDCPGCGESILAVANKCRFCGAWLDVELEQAARDRRGRANDRPIGRAGRVAGALALFAVAPLALCTVTHVCRCGHLAHAVSPRAVATDLAWVAALLGAAAAWLVANTSRPVRVVFALGVVAGHLTIGSALSPLDVMPAIVLAILGASDLVRSASDAPA